MFSLQVSKEVGREGGPMRGLGTDHVFSGPMRSLEEKLNPMAHTGRQTDMATLLLNQPSGANLVNIYLNPILELKTEFTLFVPCQRKSMPCQI